MTGVRKERVVLFWDGGSGLQDIARQSFQHHSIQTATSSTLAAKFYKPGGTMLLAQGDLVGRIKDRGSNPLGRWSWMKLVGKNNRLILVISACQVCARPTNPSGTTTFHQQESILRQRGIKKPKPCKYLEQHLQEFIRLGKTRHESVILMGDFNEPMHEQSSMARIATTHGLVDIMFQGNPDLPDPATHARGSTRIDYALLSLELVDAVEFCGYEPFHSQVQSDHRGFYLDFSTNCLFGSATQALCPVTIRNFTSKNPSNNSTYISEKHFQLTQQGFFSQLTHLQSLPSGDHVLAEKLDTILREASFTAGKKIKCYYKP